MIKDMLAIVEDADIAAPFLKAVSEMAEAKGAYLEVVALTPAPLIAPEIAPLHQAALHLRHEHRELHLHGLSAHADLEMVGNGLRLLLRRRALFVAPRPRQQREQHTEPSNRGANRICVFHRPGG